MNLRNTQQQWGIISLSIHWITVLTVFGLFVLGLWMMELTYYDAWYRKAPFLHQSIGVLLFMLTLFRLIWRWQNPTPGDLLNQSTLERKAAHLAYVVLYLLLFSIMLSGYLISTADGRALEVFDWFAIPATLQGLDKQEDIAGVMHFTLAISLILLVSIHASAAIKHHVIDKDRTLLRMLGR